MPDRTLTADGDDPFAMIVAGGGPTDVSQINLHNLYVACEHATPRACRQEKARFIAVLSEPLPSVTAASLRLIVRDVNYVHAANAVSGDDPAKVPVVESIGEDLYAMLASDSPTRTMLVSEIMLPSLHLSPAEAWSLARRQTAAQLPTIPTATQIKTGGVGLEGFDYTASVLLDCAAWAKLAQEVGPDLFMTVASDHFVLVGTMPDASLASLRPSVAQDCAAQPRCISPHIYRFRDGQWVIAR